MDIDNTGEKIGEFINDNKVIPHSAINIIINDKLVTRWDIMNAATDVGLRAEGYDQWWDKVDDYLFANWLRISKIEISFEFERSIGRKIFRPSHIAKIA